MPHQHGYFRCFRAFSNQRIINIFHQRFGDVLRHFRGGEQAILIAVFQLRQNLPLLIRFNLAPGNLVHREAFVILQREGINQRISHLQRPRNAWLLLVLRAKRIFGIGQGTLLFFFAGRRVFVVGHLLKQLIAIVELHFAALFLHGLNGLLAEGGGIIGDHRVKGGIHGAHFFLMMDRNIATRESTGNKELRRGDRTLQAVSIGIDRVRCRAFARFHHPLLCQPLSHVVAHIDFQHTAFSSELSAGDIPFWPLFGGGLLKNAAIIG